MEKYLEIKPVDIMFFRDGFPFSRGINFFAKSLFPPNMGTIYNALRTMLIDYNGYDLDKFIKGEINDTIIGTTDNYGTLEIIDFVIKNDNEEILLPPKDVIYTNKDEIIMLKPKEFNIKENSNINLNLKYVFHTDEKYKEKTFFIKKSGFIKYLNNNNLDKENILNIKDIIVTDKRLGIKIDKDVKTAQNKGLYNVEYIKFKNENLSFLVKINIDKDIKLNNFIFRLGGDTRMAVINTIEYKDNYIIPKVEKLFKIILKTPGIFLKNKFYPDQFEKNNANELVYEKNDTKVKLVGMIVDKAKTISGFDLVKNSQKEIYKAVPSGSIYLCEIENGNFENIKNDFYPKIKTSSDKINKEGYNLTLIGGVK